MSLFDKFKESYNITEIRSMRELREIFSNDEEKWLLLSTGGFHGTHLTLDDLDAIVRNESEFSESINDRYWATILVIFPDTTSVATGDLLRWGDVPINVDDVQWLRERVRESIEKIKESQYGNL